MSNLDRAPTLRRAGGTRTVGAGPALEVVPGKEVLLGETMRVRRLLPNLGRRMVGAWCFVDHYGPEDIASSPGMQVPPHPHIGLQTVSWLIDGEVHHRDSLGNDGVIAPGELGLMTAGRAITHAEQSPAAHPALLHGVQLWVALPDSVRTVDPTWEQHATLPDLDASGHRVRVILGELGGARSPGTTHSPLVGADVVVTPQTPLRLPLERDFEHALLVVAGEAEAAGVRLQPGAMLYLGTERADLELRSTSGARLLLLGGVPFEEEIVMWWNFVARSNDEIVAARAEWSDGSTFGEVTGYDGFRLPAPPLPTGRLKPGGRTR